MAGEVLSSKTYWGVESKPCDSCKTSPSILFCRADSAFLCSTCDTRVHSANKLASRHERVWLCEVCEQAPAAVTCKADAAALCVSCDADIHSANPLARRHDRDPVVPFFESKEAVMRKHDYKDEEEVDLKSADYFFSDVDPYLDLEYADSMVPGADGGQVVGVPTSHAVQQRGFPANNPSFSTYSVCSSEFGVVPDGTGEVSNGYHTTVAGNIPTSAVSIMDREARVMRYREKRKNRKFEKTIRYASRKAYAETRPRIKGRFSKRTEVETDMESLYSSLGMVNGGYGVVPSF